MPTEHKQTDLAQVIDGLWKELGFSSRSAFWDAAGITNKNYWNKRLAGSVTTSKKHVDQLVVGLRQAGYFITPQQEANLRTAIGMTMTINPGPSVDGSAVDNVIRRLTDMLRPLPLTYRTAVQRMVEDYEAVFGGRDAELAQLDAFLAQDDKPYALLLAPTGRGKTALLIHWIAHVQATNQWSVVFAPISIRYQTANEGATLGALAYALAAFHGETEQLRTYNQAPEQLRALVADYLRRSLQNHRRLLLVIDGLDEALVLGWRISRDLFPRRPDRNLRVVVAARQMAHRSLDTWLDSLGWLAMQTQALSLQPLKPSAISTILQNLGSPHDMLAVSGDLLSQINRISHGDPLTIRLLVEALQAGQLQAGAIAAMPPGLEAFMHDWLEELEQQSSHISAIRTLLGLCAVAMGPLTSTDLEQLAPEYFQIRANLNQTAKGVGRFIIGDGSPEQGYIFSHIRLRELYVERLLSLAERAELEQRFVAYGQKLYEQLTLISSPKPTSYLRFFWISHLAESNEWGMVRSALTEVVPTNHGFTQPWAELHYSIEGSFTGYLADLNRLWSHAEQHHDIALSLHCALIFASICSLGNNLLPELLVALVKIGTPEGKWSGRIALEHIRQMSSTWKQANAFSLLLENEYEIPWEAGIEVISNMQDGGARLHALHALIARSPSELLPLLRSVIDTFVDEQEHLEALLALAGRWPSVFPDVLRLARNLSDKGLRAYALISLTHNHPAIITEAREAAYEIPHPGIRTRALCALIPYAPDVVADVVEALESVHNAGERAYLLGQIIQYQPNLLSSAIQSICTTPDIEPRTIILSDIRTVIYHQGGPISQLLEVVQALSQEERNVALKEMREALRSMPQDEQVFVLSRLAPLMPDVFPETLYIIRTMTSSYARWPVLVQLAPYLSAELLDEALQVSREIKHDLDHARSLGALVPYLPHILPEAISAARTIAYAQSRAEALTVLIPYAPELMTEALQATRTIADEEAQAEALVALVPYLPTDLLADVLPVTQAIDNDWERGKALRAIIPYLPDDLLFDALKIVDTIRYQDARVWPLVKLVPHFPNLLPETLECIDALHVEGDQMEALDELHDVLPEDMVPFIQGDPDDDYPPVIVSDTPNIVYALTNLPERDRVLASLLPQLAETLPVLLVAISQIPDEEMRVDVLVALSPYLPEIGLAEVLAVARTITDPGQLMRVAVALAIHQPHVRSEAITFVRTVEDQYIRLKALSRLAPVIPEILPEALSAARAVHHNVIRAQALVDLTAATSDLIPEALEAIHSMDGFGDEEKRVRLLIQLVPQCPSVLPDTLQAAHKVTAKMNRHWLLSEIALHLADHYSLSSPSGMDLWYRWIRVSAVRGRRALLEDIASLAPWLGKATSSEILAEVVTIINKIKSCWS